MGQWKRSWWAIKGLDLEKFCHFTYIHVVQKRIRINSEDCTIHSIKKYKKFRSDSFVYMRIKA